MREAEFTFRQRLVTLNSLEQRKCQTEELLNKLLRVKSLRRLALTQLHTLLITSTRIMRNSVKSMASTLMLVLIKILQEKQPIMQENSLNLI